MPRNVVHRENPWHHHAITSGWRPGRRRVAALIGVIGLVVAGCSQATRSSDVAGESAPARSTTSIVTTTTSSSPETTTTTTSTTVVEVTTTTAQDGILQPGESGPEIEALQTRLSELGYWLGEPDGQYGAATAHAVTAFQKLTGLEPNGVAGPETIDTLAMATRPVPQTTAGRVFEVSLDSQTMMLVEDGAVQWVFDVSTGARAGTTPRGEWTVYRQYDGYEHGPLGVLYRPKYVVGGVAVHGYPSVPPYPASHGCIRVLNAVMDWLWDTDLLTIGSTVLIY